MAESARSLLVPNVPTTLTPVLTIGSTWSAKGQVVSLRASNKGTVDTWVTVLVIRSAVATALLSQYPLFAKGTYAETLHMVLESGDVVSVQAGLANAIDVVLSGLEGVD